MFLSELQQGVTTMKTNNEVIFRLDDYQEVVIMQSSNAAVRIVECKEGLQVSLYRIEAQGTSVHNVARYTFEDACETYADAITEIHETISAMRAATVSVASYAHRFHDAKLAIITAECALFEAQNDVELARTRYSELENSNQHTVSAKIC